MKATKINFIVILAFCLCFVSANLNAQSKSSDTKDDRFELNVYIPNAITPDGNGLNDLFKPVISGGEIEIYDLTIFDRNGKKVFHSKDKNRSWNGGVGGSNFLASSNLYIYYLKVKPVNGLETKTYTGHVVTIR